MVGELSALLTECYYKCPNLFVHATVSLQLFILALVRLEPSPYTRYRTYLLLLLGILVAGAQWRCLGVGRGSSRVQVHRTDRVAALRLQVTHCRVRCVHREPVRAVGFLRLGLRPSIRGNLGVLDFHVDHELLDSAVRVALILFAVELELLLILRFFAGISVFFI